MTDHRDRRDDDDALSAAHIIETARLRLVPATRATVRAELAERASVGPLLGARVTAEWPPELYDDGAVRWTLERLEAEPSALPWMLRYVLLPEAEDAVLIGTIGLSGPPSADGAVETGYGLLPEFQGRGFATEALRALLAWAFAHESVRRVWAQTLPTLLPSIRVLERCDFTLAGTSTHDGMETLKYVRERTCGHAPT